MMNFFQLPYILVVFVVVLISLYWWQRNRKFCLPPGPWGLPLLGYLPFLGPDPHETLRLLGEKYGKVFSIRMGLNHTIVINDFDALKDAFNSPVVLDRPKNIFGFLPDFSGFAAQNGAEWIEQRRHVMKLLKDIGIGKIPWESSLQDEVGDFLKILEGENGMAVNITAPLGISISNSMTSIVLGKRFEMDDPRRQIVDKGIEALGKVVSATGLTSYFPKLIKLLAQLGLTWYAKEFRKLMEYDELFRKEMESRKLLSQNELKEENFIDGYLMEIQRSKEKNIRNFFNEKNLLGNAWMLVVAGSDTSKGQIMWLFLIAACFQEVQKKVQEEIDRVLGRDGKLKWMQRSQLPYTYATIQESLRWKSVGPLGAVHSTSKDTKIGGYDAPEGTDVISNIHAIHMDPKYWKEPNAFLPERFLDEQGKVILNRIDGYIPFSMGRRVCPGEMIAVMEIFQYFASVLQKFYIRPQEGIPVSFQGVTGSTYYPVPQKLRFILRE